MSFGYAVGIWGVECILAVIGTGGPVKRSNIRNAVGTCNIITLRLGLPSPKFVARIDLTESQDDCFY
eukprot:1181451-Prorocentrum_minimum.AAC.5